MPCQPVSIDFERLATDNLIENCNLSVSELQAQHQYKDEGCGSLIPTDLEEIQSLQKTEDNRSDNCYNSSCWDCASRCNMGKYHATDEEKHETVERGRLWSLWLKARAEQAAELVQMAGWFRRRRLYKELEARINRSKKAESELLQKGSHATAGDSMTCTKRHADE